MSDAVQSFQRPVGPDPVRPRRLGDRLGHQLERRARVQDHLGDRDRDPALRGADRLVADGAEGELSGAGLIPREISS